MKKLIALILTLAFFAAANGEDKFALKCNDFALKFYKSTIETRSNENFVFSPVSIYEVCSLIQLAGDEKISEEIDALFDLKNSKETCAARLKTFSDILTSIGAQKTCLYKSWNFVWLSAKFEYNPNFVERTKEFPSLFREKLNFAAPTANADLKKIAMQRTSNYLKRFPFDNAISPASAFRIQNFTIFDGLWNAPFDTAYTVNCEFFLTPDKSVKTMIMDSVYNGHDYYDEIKFEAVRLMYKGNRMSMIILLPKGARTFKNTLSHVDAKYIQNMLNAFQNAGYDKSVRLALPRFSLKETDLPIKDLLESLGVKKMFSADADFTALAKGLTNLGAPEFKHSTAIVVNEKGTQASAKNDYSAPFGGPPNNLLVNHPFIFFIVDNQSGLICFMGHVYDPTSK